MYFKSKKISYVLLGLTSLVSSRGFFALLNDPEGPNLLIVSVLAFVMFTLSIAVYAFTLSISGLKRLLLGVVIQMVIVIFLYVFLR